MLDSARRHPCRRLEERLQDTQGAVAAYLTSHRDNLLAVDPAEVARAAELLIEAWRNRCTIFVAGNGGSASTASHFAADLGKTTLSGTDDAQRVRAVALTDNAALLTAWANDFAFEAIFAQPLRNLAHSADVLVLISCSGASPNLLAAARAGRELGLKIVSLTGPDAPLGRLSDLQVAVPGPNPQVMEDLHLAVCHALTLRVAAALAAS